jgi:hypothetical protein
MAEQFLHRGGVELIEAFEVFGMDASGHEQAIDPKTVGARQIRPHRIPDRENTVELDRVALALGGECHGPLIDRPVRLAVKDHLTAEFAIELGDGARALDQAVAAFDDDIGVGADQRQLAPAGLHHHRAIVFGGFGLVVEQAGTDDVIGLL